MSFGTNRRETTKMLDTNHPEYDHTQSIDQTMIPYQMGSNQYASQKNMTSFGQPRWEVTLWIKIKKAKIRCLIHQFPGKTGNLKVWFVFNPVQTGKNRKKLNFDRNF